HDLGGVNVHHARVNCDDGLRLLVRKTADAVAGPTAASAANFLILSVIAELGYAADNDCVYSKQLANLGRRSWIGPGAVGKILFGKYFVHRLALDDRVGAILNEIFNSQVCDASPDIHIGPEGRRRGALHRSVIEIKDSYTLLAGWSSG